MKFGPDEYTWWFRLRLRVDTDSGTILSILSIGELRI